MPRALRVFNTISGRKESFRPIDPGKVRMFVCGPTVQSFIHLGHARTYIFYDVFARYLSHLGYHVYYLMNITDFDENITRAAGVSGEEPTELARRFSVSFLEDMASLKITTVTKFEPISGHLQRMIQQVASLIDLGFAYAVDGWVYFDTKTFPAFGRLSHQSRKDLALRPLELSPKKRNLSDFALWRPEVLLKGKWESPWGLGSPGWHVQDTSVTLDLLGPRYDVHGGAYELVYPHHEAEIAQAESLTGQSPVVKYWVHTHLLNMEGEKMSKSLGNVYTVRDALKRYSADELRFFFLKAHYRENMDLTGMASAARLFRRLRSTAAKLTQHSPPAPTSRSESLASFEAAMSNDLDTPKALAWVEIRLKRAAEASDAKKRRRELSLAVSAMKILGLDPLGYPQ